MQIELERKVYGELLAWKKDPSHSTHGGVHENIYTIPIYGISKFRFG